MILYVCPKCGYWQDQSFVDAFQKALIDGFLEKLSDETKQRVQQERNQCMCPDGHGAMVMVKATDRLSIRPALQLVKDEPGSETTE